MSGPSTLFLRCGAWWLAGMLLAACSTTTPPSPPASASAEASPAGTALDPAACAARGGSIRPLGGRLQKLACVVPYADAGKVCRDRGDCEGRCLATGTDATGAATGICQRDATTSFGCHAWIEGGTAQTICID